jgi:hypothetical protein
MVGFYTKNMVIPGLRKLETLHEPWHHLEHGHVERGPREVQDALRCWNDVLLTLPLSPTANFE